MSNVNRRRFLQLSGAAAATTALSAQQQSIAKAASIPAYSRTGSIEDVQHIVVLMQENRGFDHYFGTMRGVRGYGDPHPARRRNGESVFHQPSANGDVLPWRPSIDYFGDKYLLDLGHGWSDTHAALAQGEYDGWIPAKSPQTMVHYARRDLPFHFALADAFTVCDAYYCSLLGPTDPNRYYLLSGYTGNDGQGGGPDLWNGEKGYSWRTYPERLTAAGVPWKVYQDKGMGLTQEEYWGWTSDPYIGNYGDNSLLYFTQYQNAQPGSVLYRSARQGTVARRGEPLLSDFRRDVENGVLPAVSYICAPEAYTEHGNWPSDFGAWYSGQVLDILTSNPEVWSKTALFFTYDENDGFFDHLVPPHPNNPQVPGASTVSTEGEYYTGADDVPGNYGLGVRVPMVVVSPWSTGGWVCSQVFDHTSIVRFMEQRFGVREEHISPWRRAVCGDLTSAFDFSRRVTAKPSMPSTTGLAPTDHERHPDYVPPVPAAQSVPSQEPGTRPSRALGYQLDVVESVSGTTLTLGLRNPGTLGAHLQARSTTLTGGPWSFTIGAGDRLQHQWALKGRYDLELHGPNGFYRKLAGRAGAAPITVAAKRASGGHELVLDITSTSDAAVTLSVKDTYAHTTRSVRVAARGTASMTLDLRGSQGWYDVILTDGSGWVRQLAGRQETGAASISDPHLGR